MTTISKTVKGLLFGATVLGGTMAVSGIHQVHVDTWAANNVQQTKQGSK